jgi:hypothetical protein
MALTLNFLDLLNGMVPNLKIRFFEGIKVSFEASLICTTLTAPLLSGANHAFILLKVDE